MFDLKDEIKLVSEINYLEKSKRRIQGKIIRLKRILKEKT